MKNILRDSLFCGVLSLQVAVFTFVFGQSWGQNLPLSIVANTIKSSQIKVGANWPDFAAYDNKGVRQEVVASTKNAKSIILKSTCSCEDNQVSNWLDSEKRLNETATLIIPFNETDGGKAVVRNGWSGRVLRVRQVELERLGLMERGEPKQLPIMVHLDANGVILGIQNLS